MLSKVDENKVDNKLTFTMDKGLFKETIKKLKLAFVITYTMPGIPCIYYGDEIAMEGFRDPYSRESMKWDKTTNNKLLEFLKQLGNIRLDPLFIDGDYKEEYYDNNHYVYSRINDQSKITIIINNSNDKYSYNIKGINLITNKKITKSITINSYDFAIIKDCFKDY